MKYVIFKNTTASAKEGPGHVYKQEVLFINFFCLPILLLGLSCVKTLAATVRCSMTEVTEDIKTFYAQDSSSGASPKSGN